MIHNPFATRYTAPGSMPYLARAGFLTHLHREWLAAGRVGAIIGPHGCGKTTLLATLQHDWIARYAYRVTRIALHDGVRNLPREFWQPKYQSCDLVIVDGYEQLGWRARWQLQHWRWSKSGGLLVTTHNAVRLPTLYRLEPSLTQYLAVVRQLLAPWADSRLVAEFLTRHAEVAWHATGGNSREALFRLYDCWELEMPTFGEIMRL